MGVFGYGVSYKPDNKETAVSNIVSIFLFKSSGVIQTGISGYNPVNWKSCPAGVTVCVFEVRISHPLGNSLTRGIPLPPPVVSPTRVILGKTPANITNHSVAL